MPADKKPKAQVAGGPRQKLIASMRAAGASEAQTSAMVTEALGPARKSKKRKKKAQSGAPAGRRTIIQALREAGKKALKMNPASLGARGVRVGDPRIKG